MSSGSLGTVTVWPGDRDCALGTVICVALQGLGDNWGERRRGELGP